MPRPGGQRQDYPQDEFDVDFAPGRRRGAHRTAGTVVEALPWIAAALLTVVVVVGVIALFTNGPTTTPVADPAAQPSAQPPTSAPATTSAPSSPAPSSPAPSTTAPSTEPTASATTSATSTTTTASATQTSPSASVDADARVVVLNGTRTTGLAADVAAVLEGEGWTVVNVDNYPEKPVARTTVFYAQEQDAATAQAVAADVNGRAVQDPSGDPVTVVVGQDYTP